MCKYSNIIEYLSSFCTLSHSRTNVWIYSYKQIWHERISEYTSIRNLYTNKYPNKHLWPKYLNIWIFEYIRHTLIWIIDAWFHIQGDSFLKCSEMFDYILVEDGYWTNNVPDKVYTGWFFSLVLPLKVPSTKKLI